MKMTSVLSRASERRIVTLSELARRAATEQRVGRAADRALLCAMGDVLMACLPDERRAALMELGALALAQLGQMDNEEV